jgi:hypothetical protein
LADIKYFQNEMTNVESKTLALRTAIEQNNKEMLKAAVAALALTERNYILKKDETTVDLQRAKAEREGFTEMTGKVFEAIKELKK